MTDDRVDTLLMDCFEQPTAEWNRSVDRLCSEYPALADELRRRYAKLVELGLVETEEDTANAEPQRLGYFRLVRQVGAGGMGVVYEAHDEKLDRRIALKILRGEHLFFDGSRQRFGREVLAASRLDHPNICAVYEADEIEGVPYIAMRFVDGPTLARVLDERRKDTCGSTSTSRSSEASKFELVQLVEKLARALHEAHEAGIAHRDVKPQNVLIDPNGEPVLVDFGLARETDSDGGLTRTGDRVGTPAYMAPEQVSGRGKVDRRTDVYALGVTLYECLTLRCPHDSEVREELYRQILTEPAPDPRTLDRRVPAELAVVLAKALEKKPGDRFATALELAEELRRIRKHEPIHSRRPSPWVRGLRWCQRNRTASSVMAATAVGLLVSLFFLRQSQLSEADAQRRATELRAQSLLGRAREIAARDSILAFQYAREAFRQHESAEIIAGVQEMMFGLRNTSVIATEPDAWSLDFSPDGRFLSVARVDEIPRLFRRLDDGQGYRELALPGIQSDPGPFVVHDHRTWFSPDSLELAVYDGYLGNETPRPVVRFDLSETEPRPLPSIPLPEKPLSGDPPNPLMNLRYPADPTDRRLLIPMAWDAEVWTRDGRPRRIAQLVLAHNRLWSDGAFLPDGRILACGSIWSADGQRREVVLPPPHQLGLGVHHVFVLDDSFLLVGGRRQVRRFGFDGELLAEAFFDDPHLESTFVRPQLDRDGGRLLVPEFLGNHRVLDLRSLELRNEWCAPRHGWSRLSPNRDFILNEGMDRVARIQDWNGQIVDELPGALRATWSPENEVVSSGGGVIKVWHTETYPGVPALAGLLDPKVVATPSGHRVAATCERDKAVRVYDGELEVIAELTVDDSVSQLHLRFLDEDQLVIAQSQKAAFQLWDLRNGNDAAERLVSPKGRNVAVPGRLADGSWLSVTERGQAHLWSKQRPVRWLTGDRQGRTATLSNDGRFVALAERGPVRVLELNGTPHGKQVFESRERLASRSIALSADAGTVLVGTTENSYLWNWRDSTVPRVLDGHQAPVDTVAFSPDGRLLATGAQDDKILVRDRDSLQTVIELRHRDLGTLAFTADGRLVTAGRDGTVRWWALDARTLTHTLENIDVPELEPAQRRPVASLLAR